MCGPGPAAGLRLHRDVPQQCSWKRPRHTLVCFLGWSGTGRQGGLPATIDPGHSSHQVQASASLRLWRVACPWPALSAMPFLTVPHLSPPAGLHECCVARLGRPHVPVPSDSEAVPQLSHSPVSELVCHAGLCCLPVSHTPVVHASLAMPHALASGGLSSDRLPSPPGGGCPPPQFAAAAVGSPQTPVWPWVLASGLR